QARARPAGRDRHRLDGTADSATRAPQPGLRRDRRRARHPAQAADRREPARAAARRRSRADDLSRGPGTRGPVMSRHTGHIELDRTVASIVVGNRHRTDLGDLDALVESIARDGLLQPLTVTIDGVLVCGARRLAAIKLLGWRTVSVWVRSGVSGRLGHLLAEQDDNLLHKNLTPSEKTALYRELKTLMAEDASRRQAGTRFSVENQPGKDGAGNFPAPSEAAGRANEDRKSVVQGKSVELGR